MLLLLDDGQLPGAMNRRDRIVNPGQPLRASQHACIGLTVQSPANPGAVRITADSHPTVPLYRLPVVVCIGDKAVLADNHHLPVATGSAQRVVCVDALEYVIDDQQLLTEIGRIVEPGGRVEIAVPNARGFGRLDGLNSCRYLRDTTGRGAAARLLAEVGWRRHYYPDELESMMALTGFRDISTRTVGMGLSEILAFGDALVGRSTIGEARTARPLACSTPGGIRVPANLGALIVATAIRR